MIKRIVQRMSRMCPAAWYIYKRSMQLSLVLLACGLLLTLAPSQYLSSHTLLRLSNAYFECVEGVLLLAALLPVLIEDQQSRR